MENDEKFLRSLSIIELKEMLHKKQIDNVGIYDQESLIALLLGKNEQQEVEIKLPESYMKLFQVWVCFVTSLLARKRTQPSSTRAYERISKEASTRS